MNFSYSKIVDKKTCVLCKTKDEVISLLEWGHRNELKWLTGESLLDSKYFTVFPACFYLKGGFIICEKYANSYGFNVINFENAKENKKTKRSLKKIPKKKK